MVRSSRVDGLLPLRAAPSERERAQSALHEPGADARRSDGPDWNSSVHSADSGSRVSDRRSRARWTAPTPVTQGKRIDATRPGVNPDASLFVVADGDSAPGERHGADARDARIDSAAQRRAVIVGARPGRTEDCNSDCPGRSDCKAPLGNDTGHRGTNARCTPSATPADEGWISTQTGSILPVGRAWHGLGARHRKDWPVRADAVPVSTAQTI